ncbi:hypothetical protein MATL_G00014400 [Megalops atlanticus]|uniref:IF rod domain-containing protein n=1 Tax=Megalops atlanticus TaxID=7932 RepID=A0A9D3TLK0_MEGAT|nr:hypothetical protein MATL_G00014400 [Megalops atlanticus]
MSVKVSRSTTFSTRSGGFSSGSLLGSGFSSSSGNYLGQRESYSSTSSRAASVYGGEGSYGTRISRSVSSFSMAAPNSEFSLSANEKLTMQNLNDRLATYLEKVRSLEVANRKLELQIQEFFEKRSPVSAKDLTGYFATIAELRKKISESYLGQAQITLKVDNARLAAEDFRIKYESEMNMRKMAEADVARMRKVLDELTMTRSDLEMQLEGLKEELIFLKKSHEEDVQVLRAQQSGAVNVEMDCAGSADLVKELQDMREQYEAQIERNRKEAEIWFQGKVEGLNCQMTTSTKDIKVSQTELTDLKRSYQNLEIELQGLYTQKSHLEKSMADVTERYSLQLSQLQLRINSMEAELQQLTMSIQQQASEYSLLLDIKMRLELEIAEYRRLLDGDAVSTSVVSTNISTTSMKKEVLVKETVEEVEEHNPHVQRRVRVIVEEMVNGEVVSRSEEENIQDVTKP